MKNFLQSSADPTKVALTVRGGVGFIISLATVWFTMKGMPQEVKTVSDGLNLVADQVIVLVGLVSQTVFGAITLYALVRKVIYPFINK